jgi:hypothetical protein
MGGFDATVLWAKYLRGDNSALEQLIEYNTADVVHLKAIMEICYDKMSCRTAEFLQKAVPSVFTGVGDIPKSRRSAVASSARKVPIKICGGDIVSNLLEKASHDSRAPRIVGIDLTGSERRATGWALLDIVLFVILAEWALVPISPCSPRSRRLAYSEDCFLRGKCQAMKVKSFKYERNWTSYVQHV